MVMVVLFSVSWVYFFADDTVSRPILMCPQRREVFWQSEKKEKIVSV